MGRIVAERNVVVTPTRANVTTCCMARRPQPSSERRASARVPHRVRAVLSTRVGEVAADVVDISEGGIGVEINGELRDNEFVRVLFPLAPDDETSNWVDPDALVARVHGTTSSGRSRLGLSFFQLPPDTLRRIAACVASRLQPTAPAATIPAAPKRIAPAATVPPSVSNTPTRELPKARQEVPASTTPQREVAPVHQPPWVPKTPPLHIPRTSARELRDLFHEALASLEEDTGGKKTPS